MAETKKPQSKKDEVGELEAKKQLFERNQEIEMLKKELEEIKKAGSGKSETTAPNESIEELKQQMAAIKADADAMRRNVMGMAPYGQKIIFREPTSADLVPEGEEVTFIARSVLFVVASYRDHRGIEQLPPHKLIVFQYAASDIRKDGPEEKIINFSQYTTNLKTEINFLRNHPYYGITFGENANEMANENPEEIAFKTMAATQVSAMTPESVFQHAEIYNIPNFRAKSANQLRGLIIEAMAKEYKIERKNQQNELAKRNALRQLAKAAEQEE